MKKSKKSTGKGPEIQTSSDTLPLNKTMSPQNKKKKKFKIGFGRRKQQENLEKTMPLSKHDDKSGSVASQQHPTDESNKASQSTTDAEFFLQEDSLPQDDTALQKKKDEFSTRKKKLLTQKNMEGKPVYLEDTGEKLGTVFGMIYDGGKNFVGYKIKDEKSDTVLSFSLDHFDEDRDGLIFVPGWYMKAIKTIEKFEFKDRISPEITTLLADATISNEELYDIFLKHDDEMATYMDEAAALKELLIERLRLLEKQRLALKDNLMDLTEKRLIKDIDRRQFSEDVMKHRRRVNILDVNIKKCKELLQRFENTSFGIIQNHAVEKNQSKTEWYALQSARPSERQNPVSISEAEQLYKQKYYELKERFQQLEENYSELKIAVEKLVTKTDHFE